MKMNIRAYALTCGSLMGLGVFLFVWKVILFGGTLRKNLFLGQILPEHRFTPLMSVVGLVWGFLEGYAGGALFAWTYNTLTDIMNNSPGREEKKPHHHREHDHSPWLYALVHRVPGIHA